MPCALCCHATLWHTKKPCAAISLPCSSHVSKVCAPGIRVHMRSTPGPLQVQPFVHNLHRATSCSAASLNSCLSISCTDKKSRMPGRLGRSPCSPCSATGTFLMEGSMCWCFRKWHATMSATAFLQALTNLHTTVRHCHSFLLGAQTIEASVQQSLLRASMYHKRPTFGANTSQTLMHQYLAGKLKECRYAPPHGRVIVALGAARLLQHTL